MAAFSSFNKLASTIEWQAHTYEVLEEIAHIESQLKDAETGLSAEKAGSA